MDTDSELMRSLLCCVTPPEPQSQGSFWWMATCINYPSKALPCLLLYLVGSTSYSQSQGLPGAGVGVGHPGLACSRYRNQGGAGFFFTGLWAGCPMPLAVCRTMSVPDTHGTKLQVWIWDLLQRWAQPVELSCKPGKAPTACQVTGSWRCFGTLS